MEGEGQGRTRSEGERNGMSKLADTGTEEE